MALNDAILWPTQPSNDVWLRDPNATAPVIATAPSVIQLLTLYSTANP